MSPILLISIIILIVLLCIPATRGEIVEFFIDHFPTTTTLLLIIAAVIILPTAIIWSIYGLSTLIVLFMLSIFSIWSSVARWITTAILIIGVLVVFFYPPVKNFVVTNYPASVDWVSDNKEYTNVKIRESSLSMKNAIEGSAVTNGTFGHTSENGIGYDHLGAEISGLVFKTGQPVKSMGKIISQDKTGNEGLIQVMFPNKHGNFVGGQLAWIPIRSVTWEKQTEKTDNKSSTAPRTSATPKVGMAPPRVEYPLCEGERWKAFLKGQASPEAQTPQAALDEQACPEGLVWRAFLEGQAHQKELNLRNRQVRY